MRRKELGFWYVAAIRVLRPLLRVFTKRIWEGAENLPAQGGVIVAANHISHLDPLTIAHFLVNHGRPPRFLAKSELFHVFFLQRVMRSAKQIPVFRGAPDAAQALAAAVEALDKGELVLIYPEGTVTRDPEMWPMTAKTGIARLALMTGKPVLPLGHFGTQQIMRPYAKELRLLPRKTVRFRLGPPVDLSAYTGAEPSVEVLRAMTERIMVSVRALVGEVRGEIPPAEIYDPRVRGYGKRGKPGAAA